MMSLPRIDGNRSDSRSSRSASPKGRDSTPNQKVIRKNVGRSLLVEDLRRESNKTPVPLRRSQAQPLKNSRGMMGSKSLQKMDTVSVSNVSRMDMDRQNEFNEALKKKLSY